MCSSTWSLTHVRFLITVSLDLVTEDDERAMNEESWPEIHVETFDGVYFHASMALENGDRFTGNGWSCEEAVAFLELVVCKHYMVS